MEQQEVIVGIEVEGEAVIRSDPVLWQQPRGTTQLNQGLEA